MTAILRIASILFLGLLLFAMVMGVSALTFHLMEREEIKSQCPALVKEWQAVGVPKHLQIKCEAEI